ncbi:MAG: rhomboid family intramembrane serine protease [Bacteroidales bacterium]
MIVKPDNGLTRSPDSFYQKKFLLSIIIPALFVFVMWFVKVTEILFETDFSFLGIYPLSLKGLPGILFSPFIHGDFKHLYSNTIPLLFLGTALFYFYSEPALKIWFLNYFLTGILVWLTGRAAWHIGASGLVYGLTAFLFFSGIIRRYYRLAALSLLVVFLYGSMVWGMFPGFYRDVSWESHMMGFVSGILLAIIYRHEGPQRPVYKWLDEEEELNETEFCSDNSENDTDEK